MVCACAVFTTFQFNCQFIEARARKKKMDDLDPLDPAAYSDVPRYTMQYYNEKGS
jgi:hypothetical protein